MLRAKNRHVLAVLVIMLLLASGQEIYNELALTATKAASVVIKEVINDSPVYGISEEELKQIQNVCESGKRYELPDTAITKYISGKEADSMEKVIFIKDEILNKWIQAPRRMGETDQSYERRYSHQDILIQDIELVKVKDKSAEESDKVLASIDFTEYHRNVVENKYHGEIIFQLRKLALNKWKIENITIKPIGLFGNE